MLALPLGRKSKCGYEVLFGGVVPLLTGTLQSRCDNFDNLFQRCGVVRSGGWRPMPAVRYQRDQGRLRRRPIRSGSAVKQPGLVGIRFSLPWALPDLDWRRYRGLLELRLVLGCRSLLCDSLALLCFSAGLFCAGCQPHGPLRNVAASLAWISADPDLLSWLYAEFIQLDHGASGKYQNTAV